MLATQNLEPEIIKAARGNALEAFKEALAKDPTQINVQGKGGLTAAHWAGSNRNLQIAILCLQNPYLDLFVQDVKGRRPVNHAIDSGADQIMKLYQTKMYDGMVPEEILEMKI